MCLPVNTCEINIFKSRLSSSLVGNLKQREDCCCRNLEKEVVLVGVEDLGLELSPNHPHPVIDSD